MSEPAHDLGVVLRTLNDELLAGDTAKVALERCGKVASLTGVDTEAIWQWAFIERVSTGLFLQRRWSPHHGGLCAETLTRGRLT